MAVRMLQRRGTAAEWAAENPVLASGEIGFETDTKLIKAGDGVTAWNDLTGPYLARAGGTMLGALELIAPTDPPHAARKADVDAEAVLRLDADTAISNNLNTHSNLTDPHAATSLATPSRLILRDSSGRARVAAPEHDDDIARLIDVPDLSVVKSELLDNDAGISIRLWGLEASVLGNAEQMQSWQGEAFLNVQDNIASTDLTVVRGATIEEGYAEIFEPSELVEGLDDSDNHYNVSACGIVIEIDAPATSIRAYRSYASTTNYYLACRIYDASNNVLDEQPVPANNSWVEFMGTFPAGTYKIQTVWTQDVTAKKNPNAVFPYSSPEGNVRITGGLLELSNHASQWEFSNVEATFAESTGELILNTVTLDEPSDAVYLLSSEIVDPGVSIIYESRLDNAQAWVTTPPGELTSLGHSGTNLEVRATITKPLELLANKLVWLIAYAS